MGNDNNEETETFDVFNDLTFEELTALLGSFKILSKSEQRNLVGFMKKLERTDPEKVIQLRNKVASDMASHGEQMGDNFDGGNQPGEAFGGDDSDQKGQEMEEKEEGEIADIMGNDHDDSEGNDADMFHRKMRENDNEMRIRPGFNQMRRGFF